MVLHLLSIHLKVMSIKEIYLHRSQDVCGGGGGEEGGKLFRSFDNKSVGEFIESISRAEH